MAGPISTNPSLTKPKKPLDFGSFMKGFLFGLIVAVIVMFFLARSGTLPFI